MKRTVCAVAAFLLTATCFIIGSVAFDANDYDDGGGGGYDGGGWDGGPGEWNYGGGNNRNDRGGSGEYVIDDESGRVFTFIMILILAFVVIASWVEYRRRKTKNAGSPTRYNPGQNVILPDRTELIQSIIRQGDPNFSAGDFISFVKEVYIDIETAWMNRDMSPVRPVMHDNLYNTTVRQVQAKIEQGVVCRYESMVVNTAYLTSYARDRQFEYVTLYLNARRFDRQEDEKTGEILRGDRTTRWDMRYKMKFVRSVGVKTKESGADYRAHNCPNCGAPLEISSSGKCGYCNSVVTTGRYGWVLCDYGTVRDDTVDEGVVN